MTPAPKPLPTPAPGLAATFAKGAAPPEVQGSSTAVSKPAPGSATARPVPPLQGTAAGTAAADIGARTRTGAKATPEVSDATEGLATPNFWGDDAEHQPLLPTYLPEPAEQAQEESGSAHELQIDRASAGALLGSAFFAFPALAVLITGLALGYHAATILGVFVAVAIPLGALGSLIVGFTTWRTLRRWPVEPAPPAAQMSTLPPIKLHTGLSVVLAGLLVAALLLAPPSGSGSAAGALAGVAASLALAAYFGSLPLRSYERKRWTLLWVDRRSKGLRTFFTTPVPGPSHSASALRFDEQEADSAHATAAAGQSEPVSKE